ncbi:MAG: PH domain-containing protein, partial [Flavobacterium sp.]
MTEFINEPIDTTALPRFEEVQLTPIHPGYWKIVLINFSIAYLIVGGICGAALWFIEELHPFIVLIITAYVLIVALNLWISRISFRNKGYAFRTHDAIYRSGAIAITTTIIPYNRVQHVALHEGWLSRKLGLAAVEIFTAGGDSSDVKVVGIEKEQAE